MITRLRKDRGFTLIELLVVITIIAILATVATPMIGKARLTARVIPATKNVQSILTYMALYSGDYGGLYPEGTGSSNEALRELFDGTCDVEKIFYLQSDRMFCNPKQAPDEEYEDGDNALDAGENHWAYVSGLTDSNKGATPVLADGFTSGEIGMYEDKSHVWAKLDKAIVGFLDGSASAIKLTDGFTVPAPNGDEDLFKMDDIVEDENIEVLNPLKRRRGASDDEE
jgi:prepilin-type N-terminal cleavage/methylation domain-containing protein